MCAHSCRSLSQPRHSPAVVDQQHQQTPWSQTHSIHHCNGPVTVHSHAETSCPEKRNEAAASWPSPISRRRPDGRHLCRQHSPARPPPVRSTVCPWWCATVIPGGHTLWHAGGYVPGRPIYIQGRPGTLFGAPPPLPVRYAILELSVLCPPVRGGDARCLCVWPLQDVWSLQGGKGSVCMGAQPSLPVRHTHRCIRTA